MQDDLTEQHHCCQRCKRVKWKVTKEAAMNAAEELNNDSTFTVR